MTQSNLRRSIEDWIEHAIKLLDQIDGDPDDEIETDFDINPISLQSTDRVQPKHVTMRSAA